MQAFAALKQAHMRRSRKYSARNQALASEARALLAEGRGSVLRPEHEVAAEWDDLHRDHMRQGYLRCAAAR